MAKTIRTKSLVFLLALTTLLFIFRLLVLWNRFLPDFNVYYKAGEALFNQHNPYRNLNAFTAYNYPPFTALFFIPLTRIPYGLAQNIFLVINLISVLAIIAICLKCLNQFNLRNFLLFSTLSLIYFPVNFTLGMGQDNNLAFLFLLLGFINSKQKNNFLSSVSNSLAVALKPVLIFVLLFYLIKKSFKIFFYTVFFILIITLLSTLFLGLNYYTYFLTIVFPSLFNFTGREIYYNQGIAGFISRLTSNFLSRKILTLSITSLLLIQTAVFIRKNDQEDNYLFSIFLCLLVLIDTLSWQHHFIFLIFPFIYAFYRLKKYNNSLTYLPLLIAYLLTALTVKNPALFLKFPANLLLSNTFYGAILLFIIILSLNKSGCYFVKRIYTSLYLIFLTFTLFQYLYYISCRSTVCLH